jgi:transcriptional regulator GlxA family with amidase domain
MRTTLLLLCFFAFFQFRVHAQAPDPGATPKTICFYLQDGVELLDFAGPMEVFSYAGFKVFTVSLRKEPITSQGILKIVPDYSIDDAPPADIMAFFGGNFDAPSHDPVLLAWIKSRQASTSYFFSVCTGSFILGNAGVLDGLSATTHFSAIEQLQKEVPQTHVLSNVRVIDNGRVIVTSGVSAGIDGALHLISRFRGEDVAKKVAAWIEYDKWNPKEGLIVPAESKK